MYLRKLFIGCVLIFATFIHFKVNAQYLTVTGNGQLTVRADEVCESSPMMLEFLPTYKSHTKSITITDHFLYRNDVGELKRYSQDGVNHITILYDEQGRIINLNDATFHYEDNRIVECSHKDGFRCRFKYDSNGRLESATRGSWTYMFNVDKKGNIIGLYSYYGTRKTSEISMSYDTKGRIVSYLSDYRDYRWNYNKNGQLISRREIGYSFSQGKMGGKTSDQEYKFEYGEDGNPIRCVHYRHGDLSIIEGGNEYEYAYTFYPTQEEQRVQDSVQRQNELIALENQRQEKLREKFTPCRFLFESEDEFASCVSNNLDVAEKEIKQLIIKKMQYVSTVALNGKELQDVNCSGRKELLQICDMCIQLKNEKSQYDGAEKNFIEHIFNYTESILGDFVTGRSKLNKVYKKTPNSDYSIFLLSYMNGNCVDHQDSNYSLLYYIGLGIVGVAYLIYLYR